MGYETRFYTRAFDVNCWLENNNFPCRFVINTEPEPEAVGDGGAVSQIAPEPRELTAWLRTTWNNESKPGGTAFFTRLKKYENKKGSPIVEHYSAGKDAGIRWKTSAGTTGEMKKKTILTKVSKFKSTP